MLRRMLESANAKSEEGVLERRCSRDNQGVDSAASWCNARDKESCL